MHTQIEAAWAGLPRNEQERIFTELQELQKKDWKELSLDERKAGEQAISDSLHRCSYGALTNPVSNPQPTTFPTALMDLELQSFPPTPTARSS